MSQARKGRGAQSKIHNRFFKHQHDVLDEYLNFFEGEGEIADKNKTKYIEVFPKSFVNKITSPDVGMEYSANPYQGCEHGCVYCYARNTHEYWGYGAGLDFERNILVKKNAPLLLEKRLKSKSWKGGTIVFSGNTDCYQPIERKLEITRKCLEIMLKWKHPVGIITKNSLVLRDLDILKELAALNLVRVHLSITSLSEKTRRLLEPRTASIKNRLKTVEILSANKVPVYVMMAPIISSLNSHEIIPLVKKVSQLGALDVGYTMVRLNGQVAEIFKDWAHKTIPDKADRILNQISETHGGTLNDSSFKTRMRGQGVIAKHVKHTMTLAKKKYLKDRTTLALDKSHYLALQNPQMKLF